MRSLILGTTLLAALLSVAPRANADTPAQFAAPMLRAPDDPDVGGFRFSVFHGENEKMGGLDLGLFSMSESTSLGGVAIIAGFHKLDGPMTGGAAFSFINLHTGTDAGLNAAFINKLNNPERAVDIGFVNLADGTSMVDIGGVNVSDRSTAQVGFVNVTRELRGLQLGFINIAENGFLPVFPIFNFPAPRAREEPSRSRRAPGTPREGF